MAVDYIALWNEQHERANRQKEIWNDGRSFWETPGTSAGLWTG